MAVVRVVPGAGGGGDGGIDQLMLCRRLGGGGRGRGKGNIGRWVVSDC